jgi:hypothetical protein
VAVLGQRKMNDQKLQEAVDKAIKKIDNMSVEELEAGLKKYGYTPVRKPPEKK